MTILLTESQETIVVMAMMVITGAGRAVAYKVYYQLGFEDPFFLAVVTQFAQGLALPLYFLVKCFVNKPARNEQETPKKNKGGWPQKEQDKANEDSDHTEEIRDETDEDTDRDLELELDEDTDQKRKMNTDDPLNLRASFQRTRGFRSLRQVMLDDFFEAIVTEAKWKPQVLEESSLMDLTSESLQVSMRDTLRKRESSRLAVTGEETTDCDIEGGQDTTSNPNGNGDQQQDQDKADDQHWALRVPTFARPLLGSVCRLLGNFFAVLSVMFMPVSVTAIAIRAGDLIVAILAQRFLRGRDVSIRKWLGAFVVLVGLALVLYSQVVGKDSSIESTASLPLGLISVLARACVQVVCDMVGEIFMKETNFPPGLLLGTEGFYGLLLALPVYIAVGPRFGYFPAESFAKIFESTGNAFFLAFLVFIIHVSWVLASVSVARTSVVTRNMFSGLLGLVVWIAALVIYYSSQNDELGEPWSLPGSPMILAGFTIIMGGLYVYSSKK